MVLMDSRLPKDSNGILFFYFWTYRTLDMIF
jgi:hypothetical protein